MAKFVYPLVFMVSALVVANEYDNSTQRQEFIEPMRWRPNKNCRNRIYPRNTMARFTVPDDKVPWNVTWDMYDPPYYSGLGIKRDGNWDPGHPGEDFQPRWNEVDNFINRVSYCGKYDIVDSLPRNPIGRTGLSGKGILARWGPNHWVHTVITRERRDAFNDVVTNRFTGKSILEVIAIRSLDQSKWSIPGRMILPGESFQSASRRLYYKGIGDLYHLSMFTDKVRLIKDKIDRFLENGTIMYQGYVDDPRNTDNAWVEATVLHYHDKMGDVVANMTLMNKDRIVIQWIKVTTRQLWISRHFYFMGPITKRLLNTKLPQLETF